MSYEDEEKNGSMTLEQYFKWIEKVKLEDKNTGWKFGADKEHKIIGGRMGRTKEGKRIML